MSYKIIFSCLMFLIAFTTLSIVTAQEWNKTSDGTFEVFTAARADEAHLTDIFSILRQAKTDLRLQQAVLLPAGIRIYIHPTLDSYHSATELPWYVAAIADREEMQIDMQRIKVLLERNSLEKTLRHELYHLVQEDALERWQAEGRAMIFAGEEPLADALKGSEGTEAIDAEMLNQMLEGVKDGEELARADFLKAVATAYLWTQRELASKDP